jgi:hypothetical protein
MNWFARIGVELTPYAWATHILIGAAIQALVALALRLGRVQRAWWFGAAVVIGYAWSREKTEFEFSLKSAAHGLSVGPYWYRGFVPLEWDIASQWQFYAPAIAVCLIAWAAERHEARTVNRGISNRV